MRYMPYTEAEIQAMLSEVGAAKPCLGGRGRWL